jgi:membrane-associated phospholipid phosphatase
VFSALDQQLFFFFNADRGWPWLDKAWAVLSSLDFWMPFLVLAGLLIAWRGGFRGRAMLACLLLSIGIMEGGIINPLKKTIDRHRPLDSLAEARHVKLGPAEPKILALVQPLEIRPGDPIDPPDVGKSLPSGHTSNMFCFATVVTAFYRWRGAWLYMAAALVGLSRIATGSHWPTDVVVSAIGSVLVSFLLLAIYSWLWRKLAPRLVPVLAARHPRLITTA